MNTNIPNLFTKGLPPFLRGSNTSTNILFVLAGAALGAAIGYFIADRAYRMQMPASPSPNPSVSRKESPPAIKSPYHEIETLYTKSLRKVAPLINIKNKDVNTIFRISLNETIKLVNMGEDQVYQLLYDKYLLEITNLDTRQNSFITQKREELINKLYNDCQKSLCPPTLDNENLSMLANSFMKTNTGIRSEEYMCKIYLKGLLRLLFVPGQKKPQQNIIESAIHLPGMITPPGSKGASGSSNEGSSNAP